jgi:tRNA threonylcarbamoyladenosine biosynthesis protein TsaE
MVKNPQIMKVPLSQAESLGEAIAKEIQGGEVFGLIGDLGSGKTTFTKALGKALGIRQTISSPTFVMMQQFETPEKLFLYHLDLYRTKNFSEVQSLGITEWWGHPKTVTVIEWADKIKDSLPKNTKLIYLHRDAESN